MAYQNNSAAYDISLFETKASPEIKVIRGRAGQRKSAASMLSIKVIAIAIIAVSFIALSIYGKVVMAETVAEIEAATNELNILKGETTRLEMELESKVSLRNVESYASTNLGMNKIEKYQTEYIKLSEGNVIERASSPKNTFTNELKNYFANFWNTSNN